MTMKTAVTMTKYRWDSSTSPIVRMQKTCRHAIESSSSWQIPSTTVAFIENQYEDFAGIKTDGSKPNILFVIEIPFIEKIFWKIVALNVIVFMLQNVNKGKGTEEIDFFKSLKKK